MTGRRTVMEFALSDPIFKKIFACGAIELGGCRPPDPPLAPLRLGGVLYLETTQARSPKSVRGVGWGASCPILYRALSSHTSEAVESHEQRAFKSTISPQSSVLLHVFNVAQTCEQSTCPSIFALQTCEQSTCPSIFAKRNFDIRFHAYTKTHLTLKVAGFRRSIFHRAFYRPMLAHTEDSSVRR